MSNTDNLLDETVQTLEFNNKIKTIQEKLPTILDDFKKYYVFFNKNPTYSEYQTIYENLKGNLNSISNELLSITSDVEKNTQNIGEFLLKINESIEKEKNKNSKLKSIVSNINNSYNGSRIMVSQYKERYNSKYYNNILLFIGIIISGTALIKVFANKSPVN
jgi:CCR4-NOT transcriptional regulation complex NOT5 subunit